MKNFHVFIVIAASLLFASCGSSKKTSSSEVNPYGKVIVSEPCIEIYEQSPFNRAYGNGQHFKEASARNIAELQARGMFARKIEAAILSATEDMGVSLSKYAADEQSGQSVTDQSGEANDLAMSIAQQVMRNTHTIKTSRYMLPNKQFNIYVCLEYIGGENEMAQEIERGVKDKISKEDREKIERRHDQFRQRILGSLNQK